MHNQRGTAIMHGVVNLTCFVVTVVLNTDYHASQHCAESLQILFGQNAFAPRKFSDA